MDDEITSTQQRRIVFGVMTRTVLMFVLGVTLVVACAGYNVIRFADRFRYQEFHKSILWNNEILFSEFSEPVPNLAGVGLLTGPYRIMAWNLETGKFRQAANVLNGPVLGMVANQNDLWIICPSEVVQVGTATKDRHRPQTHLNEDFRGLGLQFSGKAGDRRFPDRAEGNVEQICCFPFLFEEQPAIVVIDSDERFWLCTLKDGEWSREHQFAMLKWGDLLEDSDGSKLALFRRNWIAVAWEPQSVWLAADVQCYDHEGVEKRLRVYRKGFEIPETGEIASACAPANAPAMASGWKIADAFGGSVPAEILPSGVREEYMTHHKEKDQRQVHVVANSNDRYLIVEKQFQTQIVEKEGDQFISRHATISHSNSLQFDILMTDRGFFAGVLFAVIIPLIYMMRATWAKGDDQVFTPYRFGTAAARLAPISTRCAARFADLLIQWIPLACVVIVVYSSLEPKDGMHVSPTFYLYMAAKHPGALPFECLRGLFEVPKILIRWRDPLTASLIWSLSYVLLMSVLQGIWGITPGKFLFRLRTVQTSLRRCGLAKSLLRELLMYVDTLAYVCPAPAVISMLRTTRIQRLGDRFADTIVVGVTEGGTTMPNAR